MNRRSLIKSILGITGAITLPASHAKRLMPPSSDSGHQPLQLLDTHIVGFAYYEGESLLARLKPGDPLELRRNPGNIHDRRAIEIYWKGQMLGHIPRVANMGISQMLDRGEKLSASIARVDAGKSPWRAVEVKVYWG